MTDPTVTDLRRELEKARLALIDAQTHLASHAEMNAALHCASQVLYSPLHAKVTTAIQGVDRALARTDQPNVPTLDSQSPDGAWAALCADLDRCVHGRHWGDDCGDCGGQSRGNPHLRPKHVIGYGRRGDPIVMPYRVDKDDPAAWRTQTAPAPADGSTS
jgi:hypothetical protein